MWASLMESLLDESPLCLGCLAIDGDNGEDEDD